VLAGPSLCQESFRVRDLLSGAEYNWTGEWNYVQLDPAVCPAHIMRIIDSHSLKVKAQSSKLKTDLRLFSSFDIYVMALTFNF